MAERQNIDLYEEDVYGKKEEREESAQFVVFRLSKEWYGVPILRTKEVVKVKGITYLPSSPENIAGIVNIRGNILSVTDLRKVFGLPQEGLSENSRLVVISSADLETGLLVDEVDEVVDVPVGRIDPVLTTIASERAEYIKGEYYIGNKLIGILNVEKVIERR